MILLTRQTDYGILLLTRMATSPILPTHNARELAAESHLPLPMVSKILKLLARAALLTSSRGIKGGYRLARRAEEITVADLVAALEGPIAMTECSGEAPGTCEHETFCRVRGNWRRISGAVRVALEELTLADMARPQCDDHLVSLTRVGPGRPHDGMRPVLERA